MKQSKRHTERKRGGERKCIEQDFSSLSFFVFAKECNRTIFCMNAKENDCKKERKKQRKKNEWMDGWKREPPCPVDTAWHTHRWSIEQDRV